MKPGACSNSWRNCSRASPATISARFMASCSGMNVTIPNQAARVTLVSLMLCRNRRDAAFLQLIVDRRHQPIKPGLILCLGASNQHVLGVGGAQKPPAICSFDADSVG